MSEYCRRTVDVLKLRGAEHGKGEFRFVINPKVGIEIVPFSIIEAPRDAATERMSLRVPELDEMCGGGIYRDSLVMVTGATVTGNTLMSVQFIAAGLAAGERWLLLCFEENPVRELELRVRERTAQLEAAVRELEAFSYSISHDLRAPLRAIHGFTSMLEDQLGDDPPPRALHSMERIKAGADTIGTIIDELLKLSRLGRQPLAHTTVDLSALAHEIVAELRSADPEQDIDVSIQQGLRVTGDKQLLRIALANLLDNAFKFTRQTTKRARRDQRHARG